MALSAPSWRLPIRCLANAPVRRPIAQYQRRTAASNSNNNSEGGSSSNPVLEEYLRNNPQERDADRSRPTVPDGMGQAGDIANSSIFEDDRRAQEQASREVKDAEGGDDQTKVGGIQRDPRNMAHVLDPNPSAREQWEKRQVIKMIRKGGRLSKQQFLKRTEREHLVRSYNMKTSVKKLGMLARQIAGKSIDDAIVQMRFSKKKLAQEVLKQLEFARDEAIVMRGMGLGNAAKKDADELNDSSPDVTGATSAALEEMKGREKTRPIDIQLKNGKRHTVTDRSKIYIDQAWVGRGPYGQLPDFRARGQINMMRTPWTSISVVLKEEATRVREWEQREAKRRRQLKDKAWKALPNRPLQIQRQWYSW